MPTLGETESAQDQRVAWLRGGDVMPFPPEVPLEYPLESSSSFYMRECYPPHYDRVLQHLIKGATALTVTGSPGIGTSVFAGCFYREAFPNAWLMPAAYSATSVFMSVVVVKGSVISGPFCLSDAASAFSVVVQEASDHGLGLLQLCDGPPNSTPSYGSMVCFTSEYESWIRMTYKSAFTSTIVVMPVWRWTSWTQRPQRSASGASSTRSTSAFSCLAVSLATCVARKTVAMRVTSAALAVADVESWTSPTSRRSSLAIYEDSSHSKS